jgi:hypothetical protein
MVMVVVMMTKMKQGRAVWVKLFINFGFYGSQSMPLFTWLKVVRKITYR